MARVPKNMANRLEKDETLFFDSVVAPPAFSALGCSLADSSVVVFWGGEPLLTELASFSPDDGEDEAFGDDNEPSSLETVIVPSGATIFSFENVKVGRVSDFLGEAA